MWMGQLVFGECLFVSERFVRESQSTLLEVDVELLLSCKTNNFFGFVREVLNGLSVFINIFSGVFKLD